MLQRCRYRRRGRALESNLYVLTATKKVITVITTEADMDVKLINIGNSKGIRLPKRLIERYRLKEKLTIEELDEGILIKADDAQDMLSWEETYREMEKEDEDWSEFENLASDGIE